MVPIEDAIIALFEQFMKGTIMKKLILTAVAFAALSGVAVAGERDHDMRLDNPSYNRPATAPKVLVNTFSVLKSNATTLSDAEVRRLDAKNGYNG
jgi:hypothetical protein